MKMMTMGFHHRHVGEFRVERKNGDSAWLLLVVKSPAVLTVNEQELHIPPKTVLLFRTDSSYSYYPESNVYYDDWVSFLPEEDGAEMLHALGIYPDVPYRFPYTDDLSILIKNMCTEFYSESPYRFNITVLMFQILLFRLSEKIDLLNKNQPQLPRIYAESLPADMTDYAMMKLPFDLRSFQAIAEIHAEIYRWADRKWTVDEMAARAGLSRSRFQHLYKKIFECSVSEDIAQSRIRYARLLLHETDLPVKDIAARCGYNSYSNFVRKFAELTGCTPTAYREAEQT